ncbi:DUF805 domain-containing protein [Rhizobium sp. 1399]|uniref:DUF805 domain-containing protein n=1 Tax=Rhizobium sp. 1399 TaxID=2817758 RepID=UPI0028634C84|nr:DUF805 domain-containing protein [Rhizobium sp. 1399]MDR6668894.1 uncharacterized membrane protein YhaH (DUF805 family) [Rhizobium sp. 1399]
MGFKEAVRTVLREKYATFSGRASRSEYWWFQLFFWAVLIVLFALFVAVSDAARGPDESLSISYVVVVVMGLFILATFLPHTALQIRCFHDRNTSGWWYLAALILSFIPLFGRGVIGGIIAVSSFKGTEGPNKYGADPLRPEARAEVFA